MAQLKSYIQFLGSASGDSGATILLWFGKSRYLFNCSEGTQRFCSEHHIKPSKIDNYFLTRLSWEHIGGLGGILFVAASLGSDNVKIFGPPNTVNLIESMRYFLSKRKLTMTTKEFRDTSSSSDEHFHDENVTIYPIPLIDKAQVEQFATRFPSTPLQSSTELRAQDELALEWSGRPPKSASSIQKIDEHTFGLGKAFKMQNRQDRTPRDPNWSFPPKHSIIPPLRKLTIDTVPLNAVLCYAIHTADTPGKFDPAKSNALGVPIKQRAALVKGMPVTLDNGTAISPSDCIGPSIPGKIVLIVDCPNVPLLQELLTSERFAPYQESRSTQQSSSSEGNSSTSSYGKYHQHVACVVHITPADILTSPPYQDWMNRFHEETQHIVINNEHCGEPYVYHSSAKLQVLLNHIHPDLFPIQYCNTSPKSPLPSRSAASAAASGSESQWPKKLTHALPMLRFGLAPLNLVGTDESMVVPAINHAEILEKFTKNDDMLAALSDAKKALALLPSRPPLSKDPVDVIFLGTGSATPSKYRNQSATYVNVRSWGGFLLDTGEGALGQLYRHFGPQIDETIANLKCIFISHMHADHHLGLLRIILKHQSLSREPLLIVGPPLLRGWLFEYCQLEHIAYIFADNYDFVIPNQTTSNNASPSAMDVDANHQSTHHQPKQAQQQDTSLKYLSAASNSVLVLLKERLGITKLTMAHVIHCMDAFGLSIEHQDGWKITFSGDTRPCETLVEIGHGTTLLIHEATFEDSLSKEAEMKCHATTSEAIEVANAMGAQFLMMTHFSQRYPKIPVFDTSKGKSGAGIAFDMMKMRFSDFDVIPILTTCLQLLFAEAPDSDTDDEPAMDLD